MKSDKWFVFIGLAVMIALAVVCWQLSPVESTAVSAESEKLPVSVQIIMDSGEETVHLWKADREEYMLFLPGYADLSQLRAAIADDAAVWLDGVPVEDGQFLSGLKENTQYELRIHRKQADSTTLRMTVYRASNIPAVYLDVRSGSMTYIHSEKGTEEPGQMRIYHPDGTLHYSGALESVKGRGNATWTKDKKPYNLQLRYAADLLGMGSAQKWVLLANSFDDSQIRNKTVLDAAQYLNLAYSPRNQWVDLYLNGEYAGLYLLCEKNEIHEQRVAIDKVKGNLISIEKADRLWEYGQDQFVTDGGIPIRIHSTTDQKTLQETLNKVERAIFASDGRDPVSGNHWSELIDLSSWAKKYLIEEAFGNLDAGFISQFFYWESGGKIYAGPVWDYDASMGNPVNWQLRSPNMLYSGRPHLWDTEDTPWFYCLYQKDEFRNAVQTAYRELLRPYLQMLTEHGLMDCQETIHKSAVMNQNRWGFFPSREETIRLRDYMEARTAFLDSLWLQEDPYYLVQLHMNWYSMACFAIAPGDTVPEQPVPYGSDDIVYVGWYDAATEEPYDFSMPVTENMHIYLKEETPLEESVPAAGGLSGKIWILPIMAMLLLGGVVGLVEIYRISVNRKYKNKQPVAAEERQG